ncbi:MAG: HEAT repeat domain-containing protein [Comamonadaceae bacterium]|nr:HEAT repeat domain-containing protein [Comamonadaceae bacterium]
MSMTRHDGEASVAPPDALLLVSGSCPHCEAVLEGLAALVKEGVVGRLQVVNVAAHPEEASRRGARSVPWIGIGSFVFDGAITPAELRRWAQRAGDANGMADYFLEMLRSGRRRHVEAVIRADSRHSLALVDLLRDPAASMAVRLGIGAVLEALQGCAGAHPMVEELGALTRGGDARLRADACHYLSLIGTPETIPLLEARRGDEDAEVRETAAEALQEIDTRAQPGS